MTGEEGERAEGRGVRGEGRGIGWEGWVLGGVVRHGAPHGLRTGSPRTGLRHIDPHRALGATLLRGARAEAPATVRALGHV